MLEGVPYNYPNIASTNAAYAVEDLAALKTLTTRPPVVIVKTGQAAGKWQWVAGSSTTADDALVVQCTSGTAGRYKRIYNPGQYWTYWWAVPTDWNGTTGTDAGPTLQTALTAVAALGGGVLYHMGPSYIATETTVPANVALDMGAASVDIPASGNFNTGSDVGGSIHLNSSVLFKVGPSAAVRNGYIINSALPAKPSTQASALTSIAAYAGTGISMGTLTKGATLENLMIVGFAQGISCTSTSGRNTFRRIRGDCTAGLLLQDSIDIDTVYDIEWGNFFAPGLTDDGVQLTTTASTAAGNATLTFGGGVPATVSVGQPVMDLTAAVIPPGTTVLSKTATTVTLSANVTGAGVGNGDTIIFGGYKACYRSGAGFLFQDVGDGLVATALTAVGHAIGVDFYGSGTGSEGGIVYQARLIAPHIDSFYYHVTGLYTTVGIRCRGIIDSVRVEAGTILNYGTGVQTVTGGSINRVTLVAPYTANNGEDYRVANGAGVQVYGAELHALMPNTGTRITVDASAAEARFTDCRLLGDTTTNYTVDSTVRDSGKFTFLDCSKDGVPIANILPATQTNDEAPAKSVGEYTSATVASGSAVSLLDGGTTNVVSLSLTAGDWEVWGTGVYNPAATTTATRINMGISSVSATLPADTDGGYVQDSGSFGAGLKRIYTLAPSRFLLSSTTTIRLVMNVDFAVDTATGFGSLFARRVR